MRFAIRIPLQMPPTGKLPDSVIGNFEQWIATGAPDPRKDEGVATSRRSDPKTAANGGRSNPSVNGGASRQTAELGENEDRFLRAREARREAT